MRIAIVDSGIDPNHPRLASCQLNGVAVLKDANGSFEYQESSQDALGHGTAIASIIHKHIPDAQLIGVKIFEDALTADEKTVIAAVKWCLDNDVDVINLSLGIITDNPTPELSQVCEQAYLQGKVIIAATHYDASVYCFPADFPYVLRVNSGNIKKSDDYGVATNNKNSTEFLAKGSIQRVAWKDQTFNVVNGSSYACAHFTGIVAKHLADKGFQGIENLTEELLKTARKDFQCLHHSSKARIESIPTVRPADLDHVGKELFSSERMNWVGRYAVFPYSEKEISSMLSLLESCGKEKPYCIDYPRSIGSREAICKIPTEQEWDKIDTLVCGYFHDHPFEANVQFGNELIRQAIERDKNLFLFDQNFNGQISRSIPDSYQGKIYTPIVDSQLYQKVMQFSYLPKVNIPVVAVIGTSNRQGKFTAQIRMKNLFEKEGYKVSLLTTEPHGELLDSDFAFPYGFSSTVKLTRTLWRPCLRTIMKGITYYNNPHIIFTGTQSGLLPKYNPSIGNETCSLDFLLGVEPDALVCVINPQDTLETIQNTIMLAETCMGAKSNVLFFAMTPWQRDYQSGSQNTYAHHQFLNEEEYEERRVYFESHLHKTVLNIMDQKHENQIVKLTQDFFS